MPHYKNYSSIFHNVPHCVILCMYDSFRLRQIRLKSKNPKTKKSLATLRDQGSHFNTYKSLTFCFGDISAFYEKVLWEVYATFHFHIAENLLDCFTVKQEKGTWYSSANYRRVFLNGRVKYLWRHNL